MIPHHVTVDTKYRGVVILTLWSTKDHLSEPESHYKKARVRRGPFLRWRVRRITEGWLRAHRRMHQREARQDDAATDGVRIAQQGACMTSRDTYLAEGDAIAGEALSRAEQIAASDA